MTKKRHVWHDNRAFFRRERFKDFFPALTLCMLGLMVFGLFVLSALAIAPPELFDPAVSVAEVRPATFFEQLVGATMFFGAFVLVLFALFAFLTAL